MKFCFFEYWIYQSRLGNLRNGSNAGACNLNCRNELGRANWNYGSCDNCEIPWAGYSYKTIGLIYGQCDLCGIMPWTIGPTLCGIRKVRPYIPKAGLVRNENPESGSNRLKRYCKNIDITDIDFIKAAIADWRSHRTQKDMKRGDVRRLYRHFNEDESLIAEELSKEIKERHLKLAPVRLKEKIDSSNGKTRIISVESAKQQMLNYVAIKGLAPITGMIGEYQCTCIPGRGTVWGMQQIMGWYEDPSIRYICQEDIRQNYRSISPEMMERFLRKHISNEDLIWLIVELDKTNPLGGLPIGSALSVYQDALYLSQAYHYIMERMYQERRGKRLNLVKHTLFFVDDISMYCSSQKDARLADKLLRQYMASIGLKLHDGCTITKITEKQYQDMLGFREYRSHVTIRRRDYIKLKSALRSVDNGINLTSSRRLVSMNGFIKYSDSYRFRKKYHTKRLMKKARRYISQYEKSTIYRKAETGSIPDGGREDHSKDLPEREDGGH